MTKLSNAASLIDGFNETLGKIVSWATLGLILIQFGLVLIHYVFHEASIFMQESLLYMHSLIFLGGAGYTLLHNGHVRVDVAYSHFSDKAKAYVNLIGVIFFLFPVCGFIGYYAWPYVASSWEILEGSQESSGIPALFILKSFILLFSFNMILQGISLILKAILTLSGAAPLPEEEMEIL